MRRTIRGARTKGSFGAKITNNTKIFGIMGGLAPMRNIRASTHIGYRVGDARMHQDIPLDPKRGLAYMMGGNPVDKYMLSRNPQCAGGVGRMALVSSRGAYTTPARKKVVFIPPVVPKNLGHLLGTTDNQSVDIFMTGKCGFDGCSEWWQPYKQLDWTIPPSLNSYLTANALNFALDTPPDSFVISSFGGITKNFWEIYGYLPIYAVATDPNQTQLRVSIVPRTPTLMVVTIYTLDNQKVPLFEFMITRVYEGPPHDGVHILDAGLPGPIEIRNFNTQGTVPDLGEYNIYLYGPETINFKQGYNIKLLVSQN